MTKITTERTAKLRTRRGPLQRIFPDWKIGADSADVCPRCKDNNHIHKINVPTKGDVSNFREKLTCSSCGAEGG